MYSLIRESEFKFCITTKNEWQKIKKRKLKDRSSVDSIEGYLECSSGKFCLHSINVVCSIKYMFL